MGQALVEWCIVVPLLMLFVFGVVQLTVLSTTSLLANYAAYVGARAAIVHSDNAVFYANSAARLVLASVSAKMALTSRISVTRARFGLTVQVAAPVALLPWMGRFPLVARGRCTLVPEWPI